METVAPNSKFVGHFTEIIQQIKIKGPLKTYLVCFFGKQNIENCYENIDPNIDPYLLCH